MLICTGCVALPLWLDVPVAQQEAVYIKKGTYTDGEPSGIGGINDE